MLVIHSLANSTLATFLPYILFALLLLRPAMNRKIFFAGSRCYIACEGIRLAFEALFVSGNDAVSLRQEAFKTAINVAILALMYAMYGSQYPLAQRSTYGAILKRSVLFGAGFTFLQAIFAFGKAYFTSTKYNMPAQLATSALYCSLNMCYLPFTLCCFSVVLHGTPFWRVVVTRDLLNFVIIDSLIRYMTTHHFRDLFVDTWIGRTLGVWGFEVGLRAIVIAQAAIVSYFGIHSSPVAEKHKHE